MILQEKQNDIQRKIQKARFVRMQEMEGRSSLSQHFVGKIRSSQDNYIEQINKEQNLIDKGK